MIKRRVSLGSRGLTVVFAGLLWLSLQQSASASPFGQGVFGADVPFGSLTSLSLALGGNVSIALSTSGANFSGTGSHTLTVTSTDVVGYRLYVYSPTTTNMVSGTATIPTSANGSPAALSVNSWGYNTDASTNYMGMTTKPVVLRDRSGPFKNGDATTVTYAALTDKVKEAGSYQVNVVYTAIAKNQ